MIVSPKEVYSGNLVLLLLELTSERLPREKEGELGMGKKERERKGGVVVI